MTIADKIEGLMDYRLLVDQHLSASAATKLETAVQCRTEIVSAASLIAESFQSGGKLLLCGNGGSAADCQHLAAEFVSVLSQSFKRPALPAIALTTDSSILTAYSNDFGFDGVFERQVEALGRAGDVLMGLTTSGGSRNVVRAMKTAQQRGLRTIALTGEAGMKDHRPDVEIRIPHRDTMIVQEAHLAVEHLICSIVEQILYSNEK